MHKRLTGTLMALLMAVASVPALAQSSVGQGNFWHYGWGWGHMIFGSLMMVFFWGGIILVIVLVVRWLGSGSSQGGNSATSQNKSREILRERFARGEIDKEEFEERMRLLAD